MIILGIDPGTQRIGYGVIDGTRNAPKFVAADILNIEEKGAAALAETAKEIRALIQKHKPEVVAIEKLFFGKNHKTAMAVAQARGVIVNTVLELGVRVEECAPNEVKLGISGYGFADKKAMFKMVKLILKEPDLDIIDDASDALAIAIFASTRFRLNP